MKNDKEYCQEVKSKFINENVEEPEESWPNDIQRALKFLNENLFKHEISIEMMRKECIIPQNNFSGRFKYYVGYTPATYLKRKRIECAAIIIDSIDFISINTIALEVGSRFASTFSSAFKDIIGESPSGYLKNERDI